RSPPRFASPRFSRSPAESSSRRGRAVGRSSSRARARSEASLRREIAHHQVAEPEPGRSVLPDDAESRLLEGAVCARVLDRRREAEQGDIRIAEQLAGERLERGRADAAPEHPRLAEEDVGVDRSRGNLAEPERIEGLARDALPAEIADR